METDLKDNELIDIEKELIKLRDQQIGEKKIRSALFTLIIYAKKDNHLQDLQTLAKSVISRFPCRILFVINDPKGSDFIRTSVSSEGLGKNHLNVYCEQIKIEVAGSYCDRDYYLVLPHLLCDLPVYLLWTDQLSLDNSFFKKISPLVSRVIIDSDTYYDLNVYCKSLLTFMNTCSCSCGDLNWSALSGWRLILNNIFSNPEMSALLLEPKNIKITYQEGGGKNALIEAFFFAAWIASSLNWQLESYEEHERHIRLGFRSTNFQVPIILTACEEDTRPTKSLAACEIESQINQARIVFKRRAASRQVAIQYSDTQQCVLPFFTFLAGNEEGREIIDEIFNPSNPVQFRQMIEMVLKISEKKNDQRASL